LPRGEDNRDTLPNARSLDVRPPLNIHATVLQRPGDASQRIAKLIVISTCSREEGDLLPGENRRKPPTT
jgi:hypothetical protein